MDGFNMKPTICKIIYAATSNRWRWQRRKDSRSSAEISRVFHQFSQMNAFKDLYEDDIIRNYIDVVRFCQCYSNYEKTDYGTKYCFTAKPNLSGVDYRCWSSFACVRRVLQNANVVIVKVRSYRLQHANWNRTVESNCKGRETMYNLQCPRGWTPFHLWLCGCW